MGNFQNKEGINLANEIDYIAANYIISNKDEIDLTKDTTCITMIQKVSSFLKKNLNGLQANYLLKTRLQLPPSSDNAQSIDKGDEKTKCKTIATLATFYVQIANIFAAITASVYSTVEMPIAGEKQAQQLEQGEQKQSQQKKEQNHPEQMEKQFEQEQKQFEQEQKQPEIKKPYLGTPRNFCSERLKNLINGQLYDHPKKSNTNNNVEMIIQPNVCPNKNNKNEINNLALELGIPELRTLYYDIYDINEGRFTAMSEEMKKIYKNDVNIFYKSFYGNETSVPSTIAFFSDISLNTIRSDNSGCNTNGGIYTVPYKGLFSDRLFNAYATHIKEMEARTILNQNKLLKVLDELFIVKKDANNANNIITLHPDLNERKLQRLSQTTRELIIQLFTTCEKDYKDGLTIYQQIVDNKLQNFIPIKKRGLNEEINKLMTSYFV